MIDEAPTPAGDLREAARLLRGYGNQTFGLVDRLDYLSGVLEDRRNQIEQAEEGTGDSARAAFEWMTSYYERLADQADNATMRSLMLIVADNARAMAVRAS